MAPQNTIFPTDEIFHQGELTLQHKIGVKDQVAKYAPRMIRPFMPDQHQDFFASLPYFFFGALDAAGLPTASVLWGDPGFVSATSATELSIKPQQGIPADMIDVLQPGHEVGLLGLQMNSRRRNRVNGRLKAVSSSGFSVGVTQSFGNCPKYIQGRGIISVAETLKQTATPMKSSALSQNDRTLITGSDTFFIATTSGDLGSSDRHGADISHRGGTPGFVKILSDDTLLFPDFSGNNFYNTLGNIHTNPVAGLLFLDFTTGDTVQLAGSAEIIWPDHAPYSYEGARRYVKITPEKITRKKSALPYRWSTPAPSPYLPKASGWTTAHKK